MDYAKKEVEAVEQVVAQVDVVELTDLQLSHVGGGVGEITPY